MNNRAGLTGKTYKGLAKDIDWDRVGDWISDVVGSMGTIEEELAYLYEMLYDCSPEFRKEFDKDYLQDFKQWEAKYETQS